MAAIDVHMMSRGNDLLSVIYITKDPNSSVFRTRVLHTDKYR